jgi:eukaryotic-like serine/threonine-protein kinase
MHQPENLVGRYKLEAPLGTGAHGEVWRATSPDGRIVALKLAKDAAGREAILAEIEALKRLGTHPNLIPPISADPAGGTPHVAYALQPGGTLRDLLQRAGRLAPPHASALLSGLLAGLDHAHKQGVVHGDVKPENVLIDAQGAPRLGDFGLSRCKTPTLSLSGALRSGGPAGTVAYMSPEQASGKLAKPEDDLYSLGVVLFELVTGKLPRGPEIPSDLLPLPQAIDAQYRRLVSRRPKSNVPAELAQFARSAASGQAPAASSLAGVPPYTRPVSTQSGPPTPNPPYARPVATQSGPPTPNPQYAWPPTDAEVAHLVEKPTPARSSGRASSSPTESPLQLPTGGMRYGCNKVVRGIVDLQEAVDLLEQRFADSGRVQADPATGTVLIRGFNRGLGGINYEAAALVTVKRLNDRGKTILQAEVSQSPTALFWILLIVLLCFSLIGAVLPVVFYYHGKSQVQQIVDRKLGEVAELLQD